MLRARVIPCLLVHHKGLIKTRKFAEYKYVGDPINAVRIFNEKEVDELVVLDIDASAQNLDPDYEMIGHLAAECRMPLCYGGGVRTVEQAKRIIELGVEKVALSSAAVAHPQLIAEIAKQIGKQSVVVILDVKKRILGPYHVCVNNGKKDTGKDPVTFSKEAESFGVGEIVINSIDHDGMMNGYDLELAANVRLAVRVPITILGGAGSVDDFSEAVKKLGVVGVAAGSFFVFKGPYRAVLISYLSRADRDFLQK
jgi:cyclase